MSSIQFKNDKNYILKNVQKECKSEFLKSFIYKCINIYEKKSNSLGLNDSISKILNKNKVEDFSNLNGFYKKLSTIFRYNHGEVQLKFLWDGNTHEDFYRNNWKIFFCKETSKMTQNISLLKTILSITIFNYNNDQKSDYKYKLSTYIRKKFNVQVFKKKGVVSYIK